jgi:hypothetical protein
MWTRSLADFTDYNGLSNNYSVYVLENGDKFFVRASTMGQNTAAKRSTAGIGTITGGTGKLVGIRGLTRSSALPIPRVASTRRKPKSNTGSKNKHPVPKYLPVRDLFPP